jgi:predicted DNA-binding transcriptional regulator AlpA
MLHGMQLNAIEPLMCAAEVTQAIGVSRRTFEKLMCRNEGPPFLMIGRQRRWRPGDVNQWIETLAEATRERRSHSPFSTQSRVQGSE